MRLSDEAQELYDARVFQVAEEPAFLLETGGEVGRAGVVRAEEGGVEEFGRAGQLVWRGPAHAAVGADPETLGLLNSHALVAELAL